MTIDRDTLSVMEPLYDQLLQQKFASSTDAIEFCREACQEYGFPIKHETNSNRSIYIYCAHDNPLLSDALQQQQQTPPLRKRPSSLKNAAAAAASSAAAQECKWRVVLTENELSNEWTFRKSLNPQAFEHNHLLSDNEPSVWPQQVYDRIIQLARQKNMQTDEIRDTIKLQFPDITWNDRRFSNCLVEERKRMRQKSVTDKVQRLVMASTRLCSVVAANEDWASCVEGELVKMLENYKHLSRIPNQHMVDSMVDLQIDMIHSEIDKNRRPSAKQQHQEEDLFSKKRRTSSASAALRNEGIQVMSVPSCTLYIRSQPLRSLSEPSSQNRRAFTDLIAASSGAAVPQQHHHHHHHSQQQQHHPHHHHQQQQQHRHHQQQHHHHHQQQLPFGVSTVFTMTSPVSSPSSTSSLQQRVDYNNYRNSGNNDMLQSPPIPDSANMIMSSGYNGGNDAYTPHPPTPSSNYNGSAAAAAAAVAAATGDINFSFDPNAMTNTTPSYSQHVPASPAPLVVHRQHQQQPTTERMTGYPTSMGGYYSNSSSSMGREASPSTTSIQQRIMLQQEYEQHQRHLQQMESSSAAAVAAAAVANVHLPLIRSNNSTSSLNATMVQQQHHHHPGSNLNPNHPQNWS